jgi:hypothetical protein
MNLDAAERNRITCGCLCPPQLQTPQSPPSASPSLRPHYPPALAATQPALTRPNPPHPPPDRVRPAWPRLLWSGRPDSPAGRPQPAFHYVPRRLWRDAHLWGRPPRQRRAQQRARVPAAVSRFGFQRRATKRARRAWVGNSRAALLLPLTRAGASWDCTPMFLPCRVPATTPTLHF